MSEETRTKRDIVKDCISLGTMTKAQIAEEHGMSAGSVSTQMTYLRWMGYFILIDPEAKVLSFTDEETFNQFEAEKKANRKGGKKAPTRTPAERAVATAKTIANQEKQLAKWQGKVYEAEEVLSTLPDDPDAMLNLKEARANTDLLEVKLVRNRALADELPSLEEAEAEIAAAVPESDEVVEEAEATDELL